MTALSTQPVEPVDDVAQNRFAFAAIRAAVSKDDSVIRAAERIADEIKGFNGDNPDFMKEVVGLLVGVTIDATLGHVGTALNASMPELQRTDYLREARRHMDNYDNRINFDSPAHWSVDLILLFEDRPYKQAMMHAAIAEAEASQRQAKAMERMANMMEGYLSIYADSAVFSGSDSTDLHY